MNELTYSYLGNTVDLQNNNILDEDIMAMGINNINDAGGQPYKLTGIYKSANGKYKLIDITPNAEELQYFENLLSQNILKLIETRQDVTMKNERIGGYEIKMEIVKVNELPEDFS